EIVYFIYNDRIQDSGECITMKKTARKLALIGNAGVLLVMCLLMLMELLLPLDRALFAYNMNQAKSQTPDERIIIVTIDEYTLQELGAFNTWTREKYATLLDHMYTPETGP